MKSLPRRLFDIREGEGYRTTLMFAYIFLIIASIMIIKPVRNALFLAEFGVERLPYVFILTAVFAAIIVWLFSGVTHRIRINILIAGTLVFSIASLFVFWFFLRAGHEGGWILYTFYIWAAITGVVVAAQFWLLANFVFNAREAKRLFGFIGAGAISGGIAGGYITNFLAPRLRTENLILFSIGFLSICIVLFWLVWRTVARDIYRDRERYSRTSGKQQAVESPLTLLFRSRHLSYTAGIIGLSVVVANLVDYQFSAVASRAINDTDQLTAFFGFWMSTLNILSLGIQMVLTGRVMKTLGVAASLFFLPFGILVGTISILIHPGIGSAILLKLGDGSFKHSINRAGMELLYLPIPIDIKQKVKSFADVFIDNLATGLAGLFLVLLTITLSFTVSQIGWVVLILLTLWVYLILRVKGEYINSFRLAIEKRSIDFEKEPLNLEDASVRKSLISVLEGDNERQILYVLQLLEGVENEAFIPHIKRLVRHPSDEVKARVLEIALPYTELDLSDEASDLTGSDDGAVRTEAIRYLYMRSDDMLEVLLRYQDHPDYRVRGSATICAARAWREEKGIRGHLDLSGMLDEKFRGLDHHASDEERNFLKVSMAHAIGIAGNPELYSYLNRLLRDDDPDVLETAIKSAGQTTAPEFIPSLLRHLNRRRVRVDARQALAAYGEDIIDILVERLEDPDENVYIRRRIPGVLARISSQEAANCLMIHLENRDFSIRIEVLKALNKIKTKYPDLQLNLSTIRESILREAKRYYRYLTILQRIKTTLPSPEISDSGEGVKNALRLLNDALEERLDDSLDRTFRLLGIRYDPHDMFNAYLGIISDKSSLRIDAIEFLDNLLDYDIKRLIVPMVEVDRETDLVDRARFLYGFEIPDMEECVRLLLSDSDNWLKSCTLHFIAETCQREHLDLVESFSNDPDPVVQETSRFCLEKLGFSD
jgi:AAA family ATP:ADP antiporter